MIQTLAVIGVGLIGGSLALALKEKGVVAKIIGVGRSETNLKLAQSLGIVDEWTTSLVDAVQDADVVILAVPMGAYAEIFAEIAPVLKEGAIVSDAGSTKQHALKAAQKHLPKSVHFVAAHPLAGTEKSGADAAFKTLYQGHLCIITPTEETNAQALLVIEKMWQNAGAQIMRMAAAEHDALLAAVSHLPHLAAFALVNAVQEQKTDTFNPFAFAAGGFRDFTRIASSSPIMWRDIALANSEALVSQIDRFQDELQVLKQALIAGDANKLEQSFSSAKTARDAWLISHGKGE